MGLGKTRQAIIAAREAVLGGRYRVVCPAAPKLNWRREIRLVEPDADVRVVEGGAGWDDGHGWTIVNLSGRALTERRDDRSSEVWFKLVPIPYNQNLTA
jgi:SWI/SNF-related matrix-associated actin-dependent regulator 1 of chromatin subfamily A